MLVSALCVVLAGAVNFEAVRAHPELSVKIDTELASMKEAWPHKDFSTFLARHEGYTFTEPRVWLDRYVYWQDENVAQGLALLGGDGLYELTITDAGGAIVATQRIAPGHHRFSFRFDVGELAVGKYTLTAGDAAFEFEKVDKRRHVAAIPADGIAIVLEPQDVLADGAWPVITGVPLPRGAVDDVSRFALYENGQRVAVQVTPAATWEVGGSVKWMHVRFVGRYTNGEPATYRLKLEDASARQGTPGVDLRTFWAQCDPYLVDEAGARYELKNDGDLQVTLDEQGPVRWVLTARGWYTSASGEKLCQSTTRMHAYADQPFVRVTQETTVTFDTHKKQLADLGFAIDTPAAARFSMGVDGEAASGDLPVYLHQDRWDRCHIVNPAGRAQTGEKSDGWFSVQDASGRTLRTVAVRDIWQKFPKEVSLDADSMTVHFWPKHGHEAFDQATALAKDQIYKFLCFHQGALMDLKTPSVYVDTFDQWAADPKVGSVEGSGNWWRESEHDGTRDGNARGIIISNEFAVLMDDSIEPATFGLTLQRDPAAMADPAWNCATDAIMPMAPRVAGRYEDMENAVLEGFLSWTRTVERYNDYGMFNFADTHSIHVIDENRPGLHRIWQTSHYHNVGTNWLQYYRTGDPRMLRWARANTDHYINIDTVNYVDEENPVPVRDHELGAMHHMGWKTHWASSGDAWGSYAGTTGHFIDPDASLWCWYLTGNPRAKEAYDLWHQAILKKLNGQLWGHARNFLTTFAYIVNLYAQTHDPRLLANVHTAAWSLQQRALETQRPGPMWHPWWIVRYHDLTRDARYEPWIYKYSYDKPLGYPWPMALSAKAYWLSGDTKYLERLLPRADMFPRQFYRAEGDPWDWWGGGPGPLGGKYAYMSWGILARAFQDARFDYIPQNIGGRGYYPFTSCRWNYPSHPASVVIYALYNKAEPMTVNFGLRPFGGSLGAVRADVFAPDGEQIMDVKRVGRYEHVNEPQTVDTGGRTGLFRVEYRGGVAGVPFPQTDAEAELAAIRTQDLYRTINCRAFFQPLDANAKHKVTFTAWNGNRGSANIFVEDGDGNRLLAVSLFEARDNKTAEIELDPAKHPLPWVIDAAGPTFIAFDDGREEKRAILVSRDRATLERLGPMVEALDNPGDVK